MNRSAAGGRWFKEWLTPFETHSHRIRRVLVRKKTRFQDALIADTYSFGRCLVLDGEMQSAESDEFIYHESLVHPPLLLHPRPERVAILGGGEGATLREVLRHRTVRRAVMVDIDGEVVEWCKRHLRAWHRGAFADPRAELRIGDARRFIETSPEAFDVIFSDLPSPEPDGPASSLYTIEFYRSLRRRLADGGIFILQAGSGSALQMGLHLKLASTLRRLFPVVRPYYAYVPSFDVPWAFLLCSSRRGQDPLRLSAEAVDRRLGARVRGDLAFYDGMTHEGLFRIPKNLRSELERERGCVTLRNPQFLFR